MARRPSCWGSRFSIIVHMFSNTCRHVKDNVPIVSHASHSSGPQAGGFPGWD